MNFLLLAILTMMDRFFICYERKDSDTEAGSKRQWIQFR